MSGLIDRQLDAQILEILHSGKVNYWTGSVGRAFEQAFAAWFGVKNAVSVLNGAAARRVALWALNRDPKTDAAPAAPFFPEFGTVGAISYVAFGSGCAITAGGQGGMVCTDDDALAWEIRSLRDQGYDTRAKIDLLQKEGRTLYIHRRLGSNFRLTELQSAIAMAELRRYGGHPTA